MTEKQPPIAETRKRKQSEQSPSGLQSIFSFVRRHLTPSLIIPNKPPRFYSENLTNPVDDLGLLLRVLSDNITTEERTQRLEVALEDLHKKNKHLDKNAIQVLVKRCEEIGLAVRKVESNGTFTNVKAPMVILFDNIRYSLLFDELTMSYSVHLPRYT